MKRVNSQIMHCVCSSYLLILFLVQGCSVPPSQTSIEESIKRHFEAEGFNVVHVAVGEISSQPIGDMKYMGTKGFHVSINRMTLEVGDVMGNLKGYQRGERLTFADGEITIKEDPGHKGKWVIVSISSNLAP